MSEPTSVDTVFASAISLLQILQGFPKQVSYVRDLQDHLRALSTVLLLLINGTDEVVKIYDQLKDPLLRCREGCDYLKKRMGESTTKAENYNWKPVFRGVEVMLSTYTSVFIVAFAEKIL